MSKFQKNLEDPKKSSTFAAGFVRMRRAYMYQLPLQEFGDSQTIPGQDVSIATLLERYQNGQIIRIHQRPINVVIEDEPDEPDNMPLHGDVQDIVDIELLAEENKVRRREMTERVNREKASKKVEPDVTPPDEQPGS